MLEKPSGLQILFLSKNMQSYKAAYYQQEIIEEIASRRNVFFYGPGYPDFDPSDSISDVLAKAPLDVNCILTGHSWLSEATGNPISPQVDLAMTDLPKFGILNKEYTQVAQKLDYFVRKGFAKIFSHHPQLEAIADIRNMPYAHIPFGFAERKLFRGSESRIFDLTFTGIMQNQTAKSIQSDIRLRIMRRLFFCLGDLPIAKRRAISDKNIFWRGLPRKTRDEKIYTYRALKTIFAKYGYKHLPEKEYFLLLAQSKLVLCTDSPLGLVSPRVYEAMASGSVVFCENSKSFKSLPSDCVIKFESNLSDFQQKLSWCLDNDAVREEIATRGRELALRECEWRVRVDVILKEISQRL